MYNDATRPLVAREQQQLAEASTVSIEAIQPRITLPDRMSSPGIGTPASTTRVVYEMNIDPVSPGDPLIIIEECCLFFRRIYNAYPTFIVLAADIYDAQAVKYFLTGNGQRIEYYRDPHARYGIHCEWSG